MFFCDCEHPTRRTSSNLCQMLTYVFSHDHVKLSIISNLSLPKKVKKTSKKRSMFAPLVTLDRSTENKMMYLFEIRMAKALCDKAASRFRQK